MLLPLLSSALLPSQTLTLAPLSAAVEPPPTTEPRRRLRPPEPSQTFPSSPPRAPFPPHRRLRDGRPPIELIELIASESVRRSPRASSPIPVATDLLLRLRAHLRLQGELLRLGDNSLSFLSPCILVSVRAPPWSSAPVTAAALSGDLLVPIHRSPCSSPPPLAPSAAARDQFRPEARIDDRPNRSSPADLMHTSLVHLFFNFRNLQEPGNAISLILVDQKIQNKVSKCSTK